MLQAPPDAQTHEAAAAQAQAVRLWDAYLAFEREHGDLTTARTVERRRGEALAGAAGPSDAINLLLNKYR